MSNEDGSGWGTIGKLVVGCGCFIVVLVIALAMTMAIGGKDLLEGVVSRAQQKVAQNPVYAEALRHAQTDTRVIERLGTPIEGAIPTNISIRKNIGGGTFTALEFEVSGPLGRGKVEARGTKTEAAVQLETVRIWIGSEGFDLLAGDAEADPALDSGDVEAAPESR